MVFKVGHSKHSKHSTHISHIWNSLGFFEKFKNFGAPAPKISGNFRSLVSWLDFFQIFFLPQNPYNRHRKTMQCLQGGQPFGETKTFAKSRSKDMTQLIRRWHTLVQSWMNL